MNEHRRAARLWARLLGCLLLWPLAQACTRLSWDPVPLHPAELAPPAEDGWLRLQKAGSPVTWVQIEPIELTTTETALLADLPSSITQLATTATQWAQPVAQRMLYELVSSPRDNRALAIEAEKLRGAAALHAAQYGIYDLLLNADYQYAYLDLPGGAPSLQRRSGVGASQLLPFGMQFQARVEGTREQLASGRERPAYDGTISAQLRQPLLRDGGMEPTEANLRRARFDREIAHQDYLLRRRREIATALNNYWAWRGAIETWRARLSSLAAARELLRINRARVAEELAPLIEQLQAEATSQARYNDVLEARRTIADLQDQLKRQLRAADRYGDWSSDLIPADPLGFPTLNEREARALAGAPGERPEIQRAESVVKRQELEQRLARRARLPLLDAVASLDLAGSGTNAGAARDRIEQGLDRVWSVGLELQFPLQNRAARYRHRQAQTALQRASEQLSDTHDQVEYEIRTGMNALESARASLSAAESRIFSARRNLAVATEYYLSGLALEFVQGVASADATAPLPASSDAGASTEADSGNSGSGEVSTISPTLELLRFQSDLADAQESRAQALVRYQQALIQITLGTTTSP